MRFSLDLIELGVGESLHFGHDLAQAVEFLIDDCINLLPNLLLLPISICSLSSPFRDSGFVLEDVLFRVLDSFLDVNNGENELAVSFFEISLLFNLLREELLEIVCFSNEGQIVIPLNKKRSCEEIIQEPGEFEEQDESVGGVEVCGDAYLEIC